MDSAERRRRLGQQLAETMARQEAVATDLPAGSPRPGDLYVLDDGGELPLQWAVIEQDPADERRWLLIATDANPILGSADVAVPASASAGALSLRCACELWLDVTVLDAQRRVGTLGAEFVESARRKRAALSLGEATGSALERETDYEPEYQDWMEAVASARESLREKLAQVVTFSPRRSHNVRAGRGWWRQPTSLAASVLLALSLGFGGGALWQQRRVNEPLANPQLRVFHRIEPVRSANEEPIPGGGESDLFLVFVLDREDRGFSSYRLEIVRRGDREFSWSTDLLKESADGELTVQVPRDFLPAGGYLLLLYGLSGEDRTHFAEYLLQVEKSEEEER